MAKTKSTPEKKAGPRWSIGCFRNDRGKLVTVYVRADGTPMPYEAKRVGDREILHHGVYAGMPYREARVALMKDATKAGHPEQVTEEPKAEKPKPEAPKAKAKKAPAKKGGAKKTKKAKNGK